MTREQEIANAIQTVCLANIGPKEAFGSVTVYVSGEPFVIKVKKADGAFAGDSAWDSVVIDDIECGNRYGGARSLAIMLGIREPDYAFADRKSVARRDEIRSREAGRS